MDLVAAYSSRIIALAGGRVLADLPPDRFFSDPHLIDTVIGKPASVARLRIAAAPTMALASGSSAVTANPLRASA
jgi:ABC-type hemin transport system ATPase subunit